MFGAIDTSCLQTCGPLYIRFTMVALSEVHSSNEAISKTLPPDIVAVFVGATSGIGKAALLHFAQHARQPRIYFIGRSQQAADDILKQLEGINAGGPYEFIKADLSLLNVVDEVCSKIREKETRIDILFQSQGTLDISTGKSFKTHYESRTPFAGY